MFDWIPVAFYSDIFYNLMMALTLVVSLYLASSDIRKDRRGVQNLSLFLGFFLGVFVLFYMGLRPLSVQFGDMGNYAASFNKYQLGIADHTYADIWFNTFMWACAQVMSVQQFFFVVDVLYILPLYFFSKRFFGKYWFFCFLLFLTSFSFWSYGTNGIRNGLATSFFIWGLSYYDRRKLLMYAFFVVAFFFHASVSIPITAFIVAQFFIKKPIWLFRGWLLSIPVSLIFGDAFNTFFGNLDLFDNRSQDYLINGQSYMDQFSSTEFRWDFLLYSSFAIVAAWYFIIKKKLKDTFYIHLFGIYAIANAFWILVIRAAFSNRFAYLSWFLMAPVIIYPLCKYEIRKDQFKFMGGIVFVYYLFTYVVVLFVK